jgi:hypothetical protein
VTTSVGPKKLSLVWARIRAMTLQNTFDKYDGLGLAELIRKKEVSANEVLDVAIARAEERNPKLNAIVTRLYDEARAAIAAGLPAGPFTGVPYLLKDLGVLYTGAPTNSGSKFWDGFVADHDSEILAKPTRPSSVSRRPPSRAATAPHEIRGSPRTVPAARAAERRRWSQAASCRWHMRRTAAAPSAFRHRAADCSG